jgi:5-methylcytosine-specific restriction endonuclease McrA
MVVSLVFLAWPILRSALRSSRRFSRSPRQTAYQQYLLSAEWRAIRQAKLAEAGYRCILCNRSGPLQVHHRSYARLGREHSSDLVVLCKNCHQRHHGVLEGSR